MKEKESSHFENIIDFIEKWGHVWFMENHKKWNCALTLGGIDVQQFGETEDDCRNNMFLMILNSKFLSSAIREKYEQRT
jgi:hypothetical protein